MREQLTGIEAVLADGSVVRRLAGLAKDNTGYDLTALLAGSEGTLAVITQVRLRLVPLLPARAVALVGGGRRTRRALELLGRARGRARLARPPPRSSWPTGSIWSRAARQLAAPVRRGPPAYVVLECAARRRPDRRAGSRCSASSAAVRGRDVAPDATGVGALWACRETHTEAIGAAGYRPSWTSACRCAGWPAWSTSSAGAVAAAAPGARVLLFGHLGDGNLHVNVLGAGARTPKRSARRCSSWSPRRRQHQLGARRRPGQGALAVAAAFGDRDRRDAPGQARPRPRGPAEPGRAPAVAPLPDDARRRR